jgi:SAM-dependent methyltransferase
MKTMTLDKQKQIVAANGVLDGFDFSNIHTTRGPVPWDYVDIVRRYLKPTDRDLDIGTAGGEIFFSVADCFAKGIGFDYYPEMIQSAKRNKSSLQLDSISILQMWAGDLGLKANTFDVVLNRHVDVYASEIVRVLRPGGLFIGQMVLQRNSLNLLEAFGWTPASFEPGWFQTVAELAEQFHSLGCHILVQGEYDLPYWFHDIESFLRWVMAVPWPEEIELEKHWQYINRILQTCQTERGIETNEHRGLLIVQKMGN